MQIALVALAAAGLPALAGGPASSSAAAPAAGVHDLCANCHQAGASGIPACASCHATHAAPAVPAAASRGSIAHGALACVACHDPHAGTSPSRLRRPRVETTGAGERFDPETRLCVSCHFEAGQFRGMGGGFVRHPVGIPAPAGARRGSGAEAVVRAIDPAGLADPIILPLAVAADGRTVVGCGTCHAVHGEPHPSRLRWAHAATVPACASCHQDAVSPLASRD